jgi:hypothetical protein
MTANLKNPRPDIVYLRRRLKPGEKPKAQPAAQSTSSLLLEAPEAVVEDVLPAVPALTKDTVLSGSERVVRMNKRQSAIGTLAFTNVAYAAWELTDGTTGFLYASKEIAANTPAVNFATGNVQPPLPEVLPRSFKNRPVVEFHKSILVVGLRYLKHIKRIVIVPLEGQNIQAGTVGGSTVTLPHSENGVLYMSVVDSAVELRAEKYRGNIHESFRIGTYTPASTHTAPTEVQNSNSLQDFFAGIR